MKNFKPLVWALSIFVLCSFNMDIKKWVKFKDKKGNFSIELPGEPTESEQSVETAVGPIEIHMFMYQPKGVEEIYVIGYNDMPADLMSGLDDNARKSMLEGGIDGGLNALKSYGTHDPVIDDSESYMLYDKYPAKKAKAHNGKYYVYIMCFLKENRLYQVWKMKEGDYTAQEKVDRFMDSFELLDEKGKK